MYVSDHPNAALLERIYAAPDLQDFDTDAVMETLGRILTDDFVVHCPGESVVAGDYPGVVGMQQHIGDFAQRSGGTFRIEQFAIHADDAWAIVSQRATASIDGRVLDQPVAGVWRFDGPGRLAEHWELVSDGKAWDAFWGKA